MGMRFKRIAQGLIFILSLGLIFNVSFANALPLQSNNIYLPLILNAPPDPILFPNGDFEQGPIIWTEFSTHGWPLITQDLNITPYDGKWAAWLGGDFNDISYIQQQINVPNNLPYLSFWHWIYSADDCGNDFGRVLVNSKEVDVFDLCLANNTNGWVQRVIDLSTYAGQSVLIQIRAECNATNNSNLFIDHVGFQSSSGITKQPPEDIKGINAGSLKSDLLGK